VSSLSLTAVADIQDFIGIYDDTLDGASCAHICHRFDAAPHVEGRVGAGVFPDLKNSRDIRLDGPEWADAREALTAAVLRGLVHYLRCYPYLLLAPFMLQQGKGGPSARRLDASDMQAMNDNELADLLRGLLRPGGINLQRYSADVGGYPYWHCELYPLDADAESLHRTLLWTIYLNEGFSDGETEFLYQQRKVQPRTGRLLIAPAAFTHTHRGNRPAGGDKYIATSWILFQRAEQIFGPRGPAGLDAERGPAAR